MNEEEAREVIIIFFSADGGCSYCARSLLDKFTKVYPEWEELGEKLWFKHFEDVNRFAE